MTPAKQPKAVTVKAPPAPQVIEQGQAWINDLTKLYGNQAVAASYDVSAAPFFTTTATGVNYLAPISGSATYSASSLSTAR